MHVSGDSLHPPILRSKATLHISTIFFFFAKGNAVYGNEYWLQAPVEQRCLHYDTWHYHPLETQSNRWALVANPALLKTNQLYEQDQVSNLSMNELGAN